MILKITGSQKSIILIGDSPFTYEWLWNLVPASFWNSYRHGKGEKFFWQNDLLPLLREWYNRKKPSVELSRIYRSVNDLRIFADIALFSHDPGFKGNEIF